MTVIALGVNDKGNVCCVADCLVGSAERTIDFRPKAMLTPKGSLVAMSGCAFGMHRPTLCKAVDNDTVVEYLKTLLEMKYDFGVLVATSVGITSYHSSDDKDYVTVSHHGSSGQIGYSGDLAWAISDCYSGNSWILPSVETLAERIHHLHLAIGKDFPATVVESNLNYTDILVAPYGY